MGRHGPSSCATSSGSRPTTSSSRLRRSHGADQAPRSSASWASLAAASGRARRLVIVGDGEIAIGLESSWRPSSASATRCTSSATAATSPGLRRRGPRRDQLRQRGHARVADRGRPRPACPQSPPMSGGWRRRSSARIEGSLSRRASADAFAAGLIRLADDRPGSHGMDGPRWPTQVLARNGADRLARRPAIGEIIEL